MYIKQYLHPLRRMACSGFIIGGNRQFAQPDGANCRRQGVSPCEIKISIQIKNPSQLTEIFMVPVVGVEPTRYHYHRILSPARLPIPSHRLKQLNYYTKHFIKLQVFFYLFKVKNCHIFILYAILCFNMSNCYLNTMFLSSYIGNNNRKYNR